MNEGDVALTSIPQENGQIKNRPVVLLRRLPPYNDFLVCGVSTQLKQFVKGFDELLAPNDRDFVTSNLKSASIIRLGFLAVVPEKHIIGTIGRISPDRHQRLLRTLANYLFPSHKSTTI